MKGLQCATPIETHDIRFKGVCAVRMDCKFVFIFTLSLVLGGA